MAICDRDSAQSEYSMKPFLISVTVVPAQSNSFLRVSDTPVYFCGINSKNSTTVSGARSSGPAPAALNFPPFIVSTDSSGSAKRECISVRIMSRFQGRTSITDLLVKTAYMPDPASCNKP